MTHRIHDHLVRLLACAGALSLLVAGPLGSSASAATPEHTLQIGSVAPDGTPWSKLLKRVRKRVQKESEGRIKEKLYLGGKIGGGSEKRLVSR